MYGSLSMSKRLERVLIKHPKDAFVSQQHLEQHFEAYGYIGCPQYERVLGEYAVFESILDQENVEKMYLPAHDDVGLDSIYAHDSLKVTSKGAIYFPMGKKLREKEGATTREFLEKHGIPTLGVIESPAKIEGGDVVWIDEQTVAIGRGYRTNDAGIEAFKRLTKDFINEVIVVPMPHGDGPEACLHLMSIISIVDNDLAVVYSKYMPVFFRDYLIEKGFSLVETPDEEYENLGTNVLALAPRVAVMVEGNHVVKTSLELLGAKVYTYPGVDVSFRGTGGPTCLTCPVLRR